MVDRGDPVHLGRFAFSLIALAEAAAGVLGAGDLGEATHFGAGDPALLPLRLCTTGRFGRRGHTGDGGGHESEGEQAAEELLHRSVPFYGDTAFKIVGAVTTRPFMNFWCSGWWGAGQGWGVRGDALAQRR